MWLASVVDTPRERRLCLENVLEINPNNQRAREALAALGPAPAGPRTEQPRTVPKQPRPAGQRATGPGGAAPQAAAPAARRRGRVSPVIFIGGGLLAVALIVIGLLLATNQIGAPEQPTPTLATSATQAVAQNVTPVSTLLPNGILVTSNATQLPTFTPTDTNTPNPTATATPSLPSLKNYHIAYTDANNAAWGILAMAQKASLFCEYHVAYRCDVLR